MSLKELLSWRGIPSQQDYTSTHSTSHHFDHLPLSRAETALEAQHFRTMHQVSQLEQELEADLLKLQSSFTTEISNLIAHTSGLELVTPVTVDPWAEQRQGQYFEMSITFEVACAPSDKEQLRHLHDTLNEHIRTRGFQILDCALSEESVSPTTQPDESKLTTFSLTVIRSHFS